MGTDASHLNTGRLDVENHGTERSSQVLGTQRNKEGLQHFRQDGAGTMKTTD